MRPQFRSLSISAPSGIASLDLNQPFAHALARLWRPPGQGDPNAYWFLPNRRICAEVTHALNHAPRITKTLRLPIIRPISDVSPSLWMAHGCGSIQNQTPVVPEGLRRTLLIRLISGFRNTYDKTPLAASRLYSYARSLNDALQELLLERVTQQRLGDALQDGTSEHALQNLRFFKDVLFRYWPQILSEHGYVEHAEYEWNAITSIEALWRTNLPRHDILIAGTTGARPPTAHLMSLVRTLPQGLVVLPGLIPTADEDHKHILATPNHPQFSMHSWLKKQNVSPESVPCLHVNHPGNRTVAERITSLGNTFNTRQTPGITPPQRLKGLTSLTARTEEDEAQLIVLLVQETLARQSSRANTANCPGLIPALSRCLVLSPSQELSRRVASLFEARRIAYQWIPGESLTHERFGLWLMLVVRIMTGERSNATFIDLLYHPLTRHAGNREDLHRYQILWRSMHEPLTPRMFAQRLAAQSRMRTDSKERCTPREAAYARLVAQRLDSLFNPTPGSQSVAAWLAAIRKVEERVARSEREAPRDAMARQAWERLARTLDETSDLHPHLRGYEWAELLQMLLSSTSTARQHCDASVTILDPFLSRYATAERIIVAGFNDDLWPGTPANVWLPKRLRHKLGMRHPDARVGLIAHDLLHLSTNHDVVFTRSRQRNRKPTQASRWLRMWRDLVTERSDIHEMLHHRHTNQTPVPRPAPRPSPSVNLRPKRLSASGLRELLISPFRFYCRHIINLPVPNTFEDAAQRQFGIIVHEALHIFVREDCRRAADLLDPDREKLVSRLYDVMLQCMRARKGPDQGLEPLWHPRLRTIARSMIDLFRNSVQEQRILSFESEKQIHTTLRLDGDDKQDIALRVIAICDRLDFTPDGTDIVDYKTGTIIRRNVVGGLEPQLGLEAMILQMNASKTPHPKTITSRVHLWQSNSIGETQAVSFHIANHQDEKTAAKSNSLDLNDFIDNMIPLLNYYFATTEAHFSPRPPSRAPGTQDSLFERHYRVLSRYFEWDKGTFKHGPTR